MDWTSLVHYYDFFNEDFDLNFLPAPRNYENLHESHIQDYSLVRRLGDHLFLCRYICTCFLLFEPIDMRS